MNFQIWLTLVALFIGAILLGSLRYFVRTFPTWFFISMGSVGLILSITFFAWTTRHLGMNVLRQNPYQKEIIQRYEILHGARGHEEVLDSIREIHQLLRIYSIPLPKDLADLEQLAKSQPKGLYDGHLLDNQVHEMAQKIRPEEILSIPVLMRTYRREEILCSLLAAMVTMAFLAICALQVEGKSRDVVPV